VVWCSVREGALKVCEDHERLRLDAMLLDVFKARTEAGSTAAHWFERNRLALFEEGGVMNLGVEIEHIHPEEGIRNPVGAGEEFPQTCGNSDLRNL
jgi:hypothetical protein